MLDGFDRGHEDRIVRGHEAHLGQQQQAGVEVRVLIGALEDPPRGVDAIGHDVGLDPVAQHAPVLDRPLAAEVLDAADGAVHHHPGHHLGIGEVLAPCPHLPDALVRLVPHLRDVADHRQLQRPALAVGAAGRLAALVEDVHQLAIDVELELLVGRVAHPHGRGAFVAGQPVGLPFQQPALAADPVHDAHVLGIARGGAVQPVGPGARLLQMAGVDEGQERQGRVADPAVAVVPVARAAELLGERGGGRGDQSPGRGVGQGLQRQQRALDRLLVRPVDVGRAGPFGPEGLGVLQRLVGVDLVRDRFVGWTVGQHEGDGQVFAGGELRHRGHVFPADLDARAQHRHVGPRDGAQHVAVDAGDPGHGGPVAEAQHQLHPHGHLAAQARDQAHDVRSLAARRHEVEHPDRALGGLEDGLQHQGVGQVAARDAHVLGRGRDLPAAVGLVAQQGGEAGVGIEPRPAQPVDRAVDGHQGGGLAVADQGVVLDPGRHQAWGPNSRITFTSPLWRVKASRHRSSGTRREISLPSQPLSAAARASAAA